MEINSLFSRSIEFYVFAAVLIYAVVRLSISFINVNIKVLQNNVIFKTYEMLIVFFPK